MMAPRSTRLPVMFVAATLLCVAGNAHRGRAQDLQPALGEMTDIEQRAEQLRKEAVRGSELHSPTFVEERLTDGELFYRLHDYVRASIILTDIVENYPQHASYPDALFLLGESLFAASDFLGARAQYRTILDHADEPKFRSRVQPALGRLIEIAIRIRNFDGIDRYFERLARSPAGEVEAATAYFKAKYLFNVAVPAEASARPPAVDTPLPAIDPQKLELARAAFAAVAEGSPYSLQAHYFTGVIYTLRGQYDLAIDAFKRVVSGKPVNDAQRDVVEQAQLSLGRLYYETDRVQLALDAYQAIPHTSKRFETALYEIAWTYIRAGDSTRAERSLEVLGVAAPESQNIPDAKILRGNLLLRDGRFSAAFDVFKEVTKEFQPVRDQLDQLLAKQPDPHAYFRELVRQNLDQFDDEAFLPPLALRWARIEGDMRRAVDAVSDLSQARHMTQETGDVVDRLTIALGAPNRVNVFPDLRALRERSVALRNRVERVRQQAVSAEEAQSKQYNSAELSEVRAQRRELERALAALPVKDSDFEKRNGAVDVQFVAFQKQLSELEVQLLGMDARIVATDRYLSDTMTSEAQRTAADSYRAELVTQRQAMGDYRDQLAKLHRDLEGARLQVGVGDSSYERDDTLRENHQRLVERERQLVAALGGRSSGDTEALFRRAAAVEAGLETKDKEVQQVADERARVMQKVISEETVKLDGYRTSLTGLDSQTEDVVGGLAYLNYRQVQQRFYDLVLKADVGVVDVGWADREEHRTRIENLTRDRARALQSLDDEFSEIMDERGKQ
jgi:tetratricopeptide (TPR) repeat protein